MSHDFHLVCLSHTPGDYSDEVGRNTTYLPAIREDFKNRQQLVEFVDNLYKMSEGWAAIERADQYRSSQARFFHQHPHCEIGLRDEYYEWYDIEGDSEEPIDDPRPSVSGVWVVYNWDGNPYVISIHHQELEAHRVREYNPVVFVPYGSNFHEIVFSL